VTLAPSIAHTARSLGVNANSIQCEQFYLHHLVIADLPHRPRPWSQQSSVLPTVPSSSRPPSQVRPNRCRLLAEGLQPL
jgi:hypothetical protein